MAEVRGLGNVEQYTSEEKGNEKRLLSIGAEGQSKGHSGENEGNVSEM